MQNYYSEFARYRKHSQTVIRFRKKSFVHRHLFSVPFQWLRNSARGNVLSSVSAVSTFPSLEREGRKGLVVSLTTFPLRLPAVYMVIRSILLQDSLPEKICLWLTTEEFPEGRASLPPELTELEQYGLEIHFVEGNYLPHNKYYHAFKLYPDKTVVTVDDDMVYPPDTVSTLLRLNGKFPDCVCSNWVREVSVREGKFARYPDWRRVFPDRDSKSIRYVALGYGGVLYPPGIMNPEVMETDLFMRLSPKADDLWLKAVQVAKGVEVAKGAGQCIAPVEIAGSQKISLNELNHHMGRNDEQWAKLDAHFNLMDKLWS